ncbi:hypothetical protein BJY52DRAFT_1216989 [Lactarius psammicola]|nr:hypothetical protein BJY52DRAFT_1216989 [Lactarius psammicola]
MVNVVLRNHDALRTPALHGNGYRAPSFEQAVARVEHLVREEEDPLAGDPAIVERVLTPKLDHGPLAGDLRPETHDCHKGVPEDPPAAHAHVAPGVEDQAHHRLATEVGDLPTAVALVTRSVRIGRRRQLRVAHLVLHVLCTKWMGRVNVTHIS